MNLQQLYYFKTIAELEHYTRASEQLSISQSSLSHAIQSLENELDARLFERRGRNIVLTKYGKLLLPYITDSLATLEAGLDELRREIAPNTGTVTLACLPSLAQFVPEIIIRYISETDRADVRWQTNQEATYYGLREMLIRGDVDLAFAPEIDDPRVESARIGTHDLVLLVHRGHRLAARGIVDLTELDGEDYVAYSRDSQLREQLDACFERQNIHPNTTIETAQDLIIYGLVAGRHGISVTPWPLGIAPYNVRVVPLRGELPERPLYLHWNRTQYMPPAAASFRDFIIRSGLVFDEYRDRIGAKAVSGPDGAAAIPDPPAPPAGP